MKKFIYLYFLLFSVSISNAQLVPIPDSNFEQALINIGVDQILDGFVGYGGISVIEYLDISNKNISNLSGIEYFDNLKWLYCNNNQLTTLDLSNQTALQLLYCDNNQITSLDITNNSSLLYLDASQNLISEIDLTNNTLLTTLRVNNNQLSTLDIVNNTGLKTLNFANNAIISLDVTQHLLLEVLAIQDTYITNLDVSNNLYLEYLSVGNLNLGSLNITNNTSLEVLYASNTSLSEININNNPLLWYLVCDSNQLTTLDLSSQTALQLLFCDNNQITSLDISNNPDVYWFDCSNNDLNSLNIRNRSGNFNGGIFNFYSKYNPDLNCIIVDDIMVGEENWSQIDSHAIYVSNENDCPALSIPKNIFEKITIYPNPSTLQSFIDLGKPIAEIEVEIIDAQGKSISNLFFYNTQLIKLDTRKLPNGLYFIRLKKENDINILKLLVN